LRRILKKVDVTRFDGRGNIVKDRIVGLDERFEKNKAEEKSRMTKPIYTQLWFRKNLESRIEYRKYLYGFFPLCRKCKHSCKVVQEPEVKFICTRFESMEKK